MGIMTLLRTHPAFRRLWLAQVVSECGDWFQLVALMSMFPTRDEGAAIIAGLFVARNLVATLATPIAGVLADRFDRGKVMIVADIARAIVVLGFLLVPLRGVGTQPKDVVAIFALSLLLEALTVVFEPARGAAMPQVVPSEGLLAANVLGGATWSTMVTVGSLGGGVVAALLGREVAFIVNSGSFLLSALFVYLARIPPLPPPVSAGPKPKGIGGVSDMREGLAYLAAHRPQAALLGLKPGALLAGGSFVLTTVFADRVFAGNNALTMGWLMAGRGLGALVLPILLARLGRTDTGTMKMLAAIFPIAIAGFVGFGLAPNIALASAALFFAHGSTSTIWVCSMPLLQKTVPNHVLGRVLSVELALVTSAIAFSGLFVGVLLSRLDLAPRTVAFAMASLLLVPWLAWLRNHAKFGAALGEAALQSTTTTQR